MADLPFQADLGVSIPATLAKDFLAKLHYVSEEISSFAFVAGRADRVEFALREPHQADPRMIEARFAEIARKMTSSFRDFQPKVLVQRAKPTFGFSEDPHPALERAGALRSMGQGRYALGPQMMLLLDHFEERLLKMADQFHAPRHQFPALIGAETLERCRYIQSFPHSLNIVSHIREDFEAIQRFGATARWNGHSLNMDSSALAAPKCFLSPSVCFHWYAWMKDSVVERPRNVTAVGKCFRYEAGNLSGLERLWDFTMREVIFMGPRDYVLAERNRAVDATVELMDSWDLAYQIESATDPFFIESFGVQSAFQLAFDLKFEVRAVLPYRSSTLAVASFNYHQDFFGKSFNIRGTDGKPIETGCIGFGLERLALAFIAQHGPDPEHWPVHVRKVLHA